MHVADQSTVLRGAKPSRHEGHARARGKTRIKHKFARGREVLRLIILRGQDWGQKRSLYDKILFFKRKYNLYGGASR